MKSAITGHRPQSLDGDFTYESDLWIYIAGELLAAYELFAVESIISGMALGVDTVAVQVALRHGIGFEAAVPFGGQESRWPDSARSEYESLLRKADKITIVTPGGYSAWKMHARNKYMVDNSDFLIAVWNAAQNGGTFNCVNYALAQKKPVWHIDIAKGSSGWLGNETVPVKSMAVS